MKRRLFMLLLLSAYMQSPKAQFKEPATIPTPNTATLAQYGVIPMSLHTGKANISIPLLDVTARGVELSVNFLYDTSGILVNSLPSWTGHSWTLSVGGVITRAVKGYLDKYDKKNHSSMNQNWDNYFHRYDGNVNDSPMLKALWKGRLWERTKGKTNATIRNTLIRNFSLSLHQGKIIYDHTTIRTS